MQKLRPRYIQKMLSELSFTIQHLKVNDLKDYDISDKIEDVQQCFIDMDDSAFNEDRHMYIGDYKFNIDECREDLKKVFIGYINDITAKNNYINELKVTIKNKIDDAVQHIEREISTEIIAHAYTENVQHIETVAEKKLKDELVVELVEDGDDQKIVLKAEDYTMKYDISVEEESLTETTTEEEGETNEQS